MKKFALPKKFLSCYEKKDPNFGYAGLGLMVFERTYSRTKENGERESWFDAVKRVIEGTFQIERDHYVANGIEYSEVESMAAACDMFRRMFDFKFSPAGRGVAMQGSKAVQDKKLFGALNNCGFVSTQWMKDDPVMPFVFCMDASMQGIGVGFDTRGGSFHNENKVFFKKPTLPAVRYTIDDSREGWVESVKVQLMSWFYGENKPEFNYDQIRPEGTPIKTFGGIASGPRFLKELHEGIDTAFERCQTRNDGVMVVDTELICDIMNMIGVCVVNGNLRRTALIAFGDPADTQFINLKNPNVSSHRKPFWWTSNNSIFGHVGMDYNQKVTDDMTLVELMAKFGEPGIAYLDNMRAYGRMGDPPDYKDKNVMGANPCVPGWSIIQTMDGPRSVNDLVGKPFYANVDGKFYFCKEGFFSTGSKPLVKIVMENKHELWVTPDHQVMRYSRKTGEKTEWVKACDIKSYDELVINDTYPDAIRQWQAPFGEIDDLRDAYANQLALLKKIPVYGADVCTNPLSSSVRYHPENPDLMFRMLLNFGLRPKRDGNYVVLDGVDLYLYHQILRGEVGGLPPEFKKLPRRGSYTVNHIEEELPQEVFDCNIPIANAFCCEGMIVHNCLEQSLEHMELCNLVETFPNHHDDVADFKETARIALRYGKIVTLALPEWPGCRDVMEKNRRIGVSVSGIAQFLGKHGEQELIKWLELGFRAVNRCDERLSKMYNVPLSIKTTTVKPSGTISIVAGATPGVHHPVSRFYKRHVRGIKRNSDLHKALLARGIRFEEPPEQENSPDIVIAVFPIDEGEGVKSIKEVTVREQLHNLALLQKHWSNNQVSGTVTIPYRERPLLAGLLKEFETQLKGVSFFFEQDDSHEDSVAQKSMYQFLPYEAVTKEEYQMEYDAMISRRTGAVPSGSLRDSLHYSTGDSDELPSVYCDGDFCEKRVETPE